MCEVCAYDVYVCVCVYLDNSSYIHHILHVPVLSVMSNNLCCVHVFVCAYMCVHVCVCACVRVCARVGVCVCVHNSK